MLAANLFRAYRFAQRRADGFDFVCAQFGENWQRQHFFGHAFRNW